MHRIFLLFIFSFFLPLSIPAQSEGEEQHIEGRVNSKKGLSSPYVILISADGFRYDYAKKYNAKNLLGIAQRGTQAKYMDPSYPSVTGPNHYAIITGLYPSHSGFVDNYFVDPKRNDWFSMSSPKIKDGSWLLGLPLWGLMEKNGILSASLFWVASNGTVGGERPSYYYDYREDFSAQKRVDIVENWLKLPENVRPHFISLYFFEVDKMGHLYGPDAKETRDAVKLVDDAVGDLLQRIEKLGLENVNVIFVSDHGMTQVDIHSPLEVPSFLLDKDKYTIINAQTLLRVMVHDPKKVKETYKILKKVKTRDYQVKKLDQLPKRLHYGKRDDVLGRMGDIALIPKHPKIFLLEGQKATPGKHGYDPKKVKDMRATFYAAGPSIESQKKIGGFQNVNVYPIVTKIMGIENYHAIDGKDTEAKKIVVE